MKLLNAHIINELLKLLPSPEEMQLLQQFENDSDNFAAPDKFIWQLSKVNRFSARLKALHTRTMFDEWVEDARRQVNAWKLAIEQLQSSQKFRDFLKVCSSYLFLYDAYQD